MAKKAKVFAISDVHIDYEENKKWLNSLSHDEYKDDILILAGDVTDDIQLLAKAFEIFRDRFREVLFVPGNHDLWVHRYKGIDSLTKFERIKELASKCDIHMKPFHLGSLSIVPLLGWYDYSFGQPSNEIIDAWADYIACRWPAGFDETTLTRHFVDMNEEHLNIRNEFVISFSHFLPRIDLMPSFIPTDRRAVYPVLGSYLLEKQIRSLESDIHVYGHSHVNVRTCKDNITYINNAFGYPYETWIAAKKLICVYDGTKHR
jgi:predicted phosphodiesterase